MLIYKSYLVLRYLVCGPLNGYIPFLADCYLKTTWYKNKDWLFTMIIYNFNIKGTVITKIDQMNKCTYIIMMNDAHT